MMEVRAQTERSTFYALFPSVAVAIAFATVVNRLHQQSQRPVHQWRVAAVCSVVLLLIPAYGVRNDRWVEPARVSSRVMRVLQRRRCR
jgi:hypothetical protein